MFPISTAERRSFAALALFLAAAAVALASLPLFNYLGYEFSAAIALLWPLTAGAHTLRSLLRRWPRGSSLTTAAVRSDVSDLLAQNAVLLLVPLCVALGAGVVVRNCAYGEGIVFYLLLPAVTAVWCVALAALTAVVARRPAWSYAAVLAVVLAHPLLLGYATPAAFSYNVVYGFFPGFTYDESLHLGWRLFLFRYLTLCAAALFLLVAEFAASYRKAGEGVRGLGAALRNIRFHRAGAFLLGALALQLVLGWMFRVPLGFESTSSSIAARLGGRLMTDHFEILYDTTAFTPAEARRAAAVHEFRYAEVRAALHVGSTPRVSSFLYRDAATKRLLTGAGNTDIAKPWSREIHLSAASWESTLKHELVHVLAGEFGMPVIRAHYNTGLVEGLATAVADDDATRTLAEFAAAMRRFGLLEDPARLLRFDGFAVRSSAVSYVAMGAFCRYLIDEHGIDAIARVYGGASPERVYGRPFDRLIDDWVASLASVRVDDAWRGQIEYRFRRPSIFAKVCARAVANHNEEAQRLLAAGDAAGAYGEYRAGLEMSWNTGSYAGMVRAAAAAGRHDSVRALMAAVEGDSGASAFAGLLIPYGDACWRAGDTSAARSAYESARQYDLSFASSEAAALRLACLGDTLLARRLPPILFGALPDSAAAESLASLAARSPYASLLAARALLRAERPGAVGPLLGAIGATLAPPLEAMKHRLLALSYERLGEWDHAGAHYRTIAGLASDEAARRRADDDVRRAAWFALHDAGGSVR